MNVEQAAERMRRMFADVGVSIDSTRADQEFMQYALDGPPPVLATLSDRLRHEIWRRRAIRDTALGLVLSLSALIGALIVFN